MNIKIFWTALSILVWGTCTLSNAASFDCAKASTAQEKTICATPTLSALDEKLAQTYKAAQAASADPDQLKNEQRTWLKDTKGCNADIECLERAYTARIGELTPQPQPAFQQSASEAAVASAPATAASESAASASVASPAPAPVVQAPSVTLASAEATPFWERTEVKYSAIALGVLLGLALVVWLTRKAIAGAKKGAVLVAQKGEQFKQEITEKANQAREAAAEKTAALAADLAAKTKEAAATANTKLQEGLSGAAEKSAPHLQTLKGDLADMKSNVSSEWAASDVTAKQRALNIWAGFTSRQKKLAFIAVLSFCTVLLSVIFYESYTSEDEEFYRVLGKQRLASCKVVNDYSMEHPFDFMGTKTVGAKTIFLNKRISKAIRVASNAGISRGELDELAKNARNRLDREAYGGVSRDLVYRTEHTECIHIVESVYGKIK